MMSTTSERATETSIEAVLAELRAAEKLVVVAHENVDGDALGSLIAMQELLTALGKDSVMYISADEFPLPHEYRLLPLAGLVNDPPADLDERTIVFLDCGNLERNPASALLRSGARILNIDHHHDNTRFGTANYVDPHASCTAEMIWKMLHMLGLRLTPTIAQALYVGLITDTGCFMYENTGPRAHEMAAELIEAGVDVPATYQRVYEDIPYGKLALLARGLAKVERYDEGRLTLASLSAEDFIEAGAEESYSEGVIDHLRAVRGTALAGLVRDRLSAPGEPASSEDGRRLRKVSLRAADRRLDVSAIARAQGGGGHKAAAGFTTDLPWEELVAFLRAGVRAQLQQT
jgi:phosphoesterase RecJ-like protein